MMTCLLYSTQERIHCVDYSHRRINLRFTALSLASVKIFTLANSKQELSTRIIIRHSPLRNNRADTTPHKLMVRVLSVVDYELKVYEVL